MYCPVCNQDRNFKIRYRLAEYEIGSCPRCGLLLNHTYFSDPAFRKNLFEDYYYETVQSQAFKDKLDLYHQDPSISIFRKALKRLGPAGGGNILDVGCAFGTFLKVAEGEGWKPHGVEFSKYASEMARQKWGYSIFTGDIEHAPFESGFFDAITFWDVLEHVSDPRVNLKRAYALLKKGGRLLLTTDSANSLIGGLGAFFYALSGGKWTYPVRRFLIPHNTFYFSSGQMAALLKELGFRIDAVEGIDYPIEKINLSPLERFLLHILYGLGVCTRSQSQFLILATKL